ncbi:MAG: hypothetical protein ACOX4M_00970 [Acetivibrionales bacterium]
MVAGDTKRVIVIKNISSNLIEEAILILKNEPGIPKCNGNDKRPKGVQDSRNSFLLKEAENIINEYIKEHNLAIRHDRRSQNDPGTRSLKIPANVLINAFLAASIAILIFVLSKLF